MNKEQQIEEIMLTVPQKIVAYDGNPSGQHLYGEQRQEIAEAIYNAGYRKIDENCTVITKDELKEYKRQAVKEFTEKLQKELPCRDYTLNGNTYSMIFTSSMKYFTDKLLKEYEK